MGADAIELHTGQYALATTEAAVETELDNLREASARIVELGIRLHAGHGLTYRNVGPVAAISEMHELNIGHSIIARSIMVGLESAVREMKRLIEKAVS